MGVLIPPPQKYISIYILVVYQFFFVGDKLPPVGLVIVTQY